MLNLDQQNKALQLMRAIERLECRSIRQVIGTGPYNQCIENLDHIDTIVFLNEVLKKIAPNK